MTNQDRLTTEAATVLLLGDNLIHLASGPGQEVEMTRDNQLLLEREMAGTLDNPLEALMAQVVIEYREMVAAPAPMGVRPELEIA